MFGGIAFMIRGNMAVGIGKQRLMVRVGPEAHDELARQAHARPMDFSGRPMKGYLYVDDPGIERDRDLERWVGYAVRYVSSLPAKAASAGAGRGKRLPKARKRR